MKGRNESDKLRILLKQTRYTVRPDFTQAVMDEVLSVEDKRESNPMVHSLLQLHGKEETASNFTHVVMQRVQTLPPVPTERILPKSFWYLGAAIIVATTVAAFYFDSATKSSDQPVGSLTGVGYYISKYIGGINGMYGGVVVAGLVLITADYFLKRVFTRIPSSDR